MKKTENSGVPKIRGIQRKRYNKVIFRARIGPGLDFFTSEKKIRANTRYWEAKVLLSRARAPENERKGGFGIVNPEGVNDEKNPEGSLNNESGGTNYEEIRRELGSIRIE